MGKDQWVKTLESQLSPRGKVLYLMLAGEFVTWEQIKDRCGFSDNDVSCAWDNLTRIGLASGDIYFGKTGMVFEEPLK